MPTFDDFPSDSLDKWKSEILDVPGVQRVSLKAIDLTELVTLTPGYRYNDEYLEEKVKLDIDVVAPESSRNSVLDYCAIEGIPGYRPGDKRSAHIVLITPDVWELYANTVSATDILDYFLTSKHLEGAAARSHEAWRAGKEKDRQDPANPYQGYGPKRIKVKYLTPEEKITLGVSPTADPNGDVFHSLDVPFMQLSPDIRHKNVVPMAAACLAVADFLYSYDDRGNIDSLDSTLKSIANGQPEAVGLISRVTHVAWMASDIMQGGRPWGHSPENYHVFGRLSRPVQDLDAQAAQPNITYMRDYLDTISSAKKTMCNSLTRYGGPYENWWATEWAILRPASETNYQNMPGSHSFEERARYNFNLEGSNAHPSLLPYDNCLQAALSRGHIKPQEDGTYALTEQGEKRYLELSRVRFKLDDDPVTYLRDYDKLKQQYAA